MSGSIKSIKISRELAANALRVLRVEKVDPDKWSSEPTIVKLDGHEFKIKSATKGRVTILYNELPKELQTKLVLALVRELQLLE